MQQEIELLVMKMLLEAAILNAPRSNKINKLINVPKCNKAFVVTDATINGVTCD